MSDIAANTIRALTNLTMANRQSITYHQTGRFEPMMVQIIHWSPPMIQDKTTLELIDIFNSEKCSLHGEYIKFDAPGTRHDIRADRILMMIKLCEQAVSDLKFLITEIAFRTRLVESIQILSDENKELIEILQTVHQENQDLTKKVDVLTCRVNGLSKGKAKK
jgi:hypothetical protein